MKIAHPSLAGGNPMNNDKIKCAIYARVSTDQQGDSLENQIAQCREYIARLGDAYDSDDVIVYRDEAVSGYYTSVFERHEMKRAIRDARDGKFRLLVFKEVSRVGRDKQENPAIIGMFEQYGVRVVAINDNYDSWNKDNLTFDILSVLSEQESRKISARVSSARRQKARRGEWCGEPPVGYKVNRETKRLEIDPEWKDVPRLIFDLYVSRRLGTFKVAETLNRLGFRTRNGNRWCRESVNKVLRNPAYIGVVRYGARRNKLERRYDDTGKMTKRKVQVRTVESEWQTVENAHEPLIDKAVFDEAQSILRAKGKNGSSGRAYHPLTGVLACGRCGAGMVCQKRTYRGKVYRYYICKTYHKYGRDACSQANVNADELEAHIVAVIRAHLEKLPADQFLMAVDPEPQLERLRAEWREARTRKEQRRRDAVDLFRQRGLFDEETYREHMLDLKRQIHAEEERIAALERQMEALGRRAEETEDAHRYVREFIRRGWADPNRMRAVVHDLVKRITLTDRHLHIEYAYHFFPSVG